MFILLSSRHFEFQSFKPHIFTNFNNIIYIASKEFVLTFTCVRYLVVYVTDTEPLVHMYWSDTASLNCTAVTARGWRYQRNAAHYNRRYTVHRTHRGIAVQSNVTYNRIGTAVFSRYHCCHGKEILILYSECVSPVSSPARKSHCGLSGCTLFSTLSLKLHDYLKNLLSVKCGFSFSV